MTPKKIKFSVKQFLNSFRYALKGLIVFFATQNNAFVHSIALIVVIVFGIYFELSTYEWMSLTFAIGLVFTAEIMNTAIEFLTDMVSPNQNEYAGKVKDIAAAAVLVASITALVIGAIVFIPKIL